jgi:cellulose synthase/poly-beta-1,6-N-acetylglucosamine synthase-like glycosyltransferase
MHFYFLLFLIFSFALEAKQTICLNMIVKDEKDVIQRCLDSVIPVIDYWVIVDTGSTDGTQEIIKNHMKNIPGELFERPWKNWGATRTEALRLAQEHGQGDYLLFKPISTISGEAQKIFPIEDPNWSKKIFLGSMSVLRMNI